MTSSAARKLRISAIRGLIVGAGLCVASAVLWGLGWNVWVPLIAIAWFGVHVVFSYRHLQQKAEGRVEAGRRSEVIFPRLKPDEFSDFTWQGESYFGTVIEFGGKQVLIDLRQDELLEQRKIAALRIIANAEALTLAWEEMKAKAVAHRPERAEDIKALSINLIGLYAKHMDFAEVYCTDESAVSDWSCSLQGGQFKDLMEEV